MSEQVIKNAFKLVTQADSSYYADYFLRPYNPDDIFQKKYNYDLFREMREDDQIGAVLTLKKFFILSGQREIQCDNKDVADFITWNIDYYLDCLFDESLLDILTCIDFGFSITEKVFKITDTQKWGKKIVLDQLRTRPPDTFEFDQDSQGNIIKIRQHTAGADIEIDAPKVIHYMYQPEYDNPYGTSELNLGIYRAWWSKNAIIKFWNIYLERFGMPTVVGKYPQGMSSGINDLKAVLKNIQSKTSIIIPEEVKLELLNAGSGGQDGYEKAIDKYNIMIARKALIPDLLGLSGAQTSGGSYALGASQFNMFYNNIRNETKKLERMINREIIQPLVAWNFGNNIECVLKINQVDEERKQKDLDLWIRAVQTGNVPVNDDQLNWFFKSLNMPEKQKGDALPAQVQPLQQKETSQPIDNKTPEENQNPAGDVVKEFRAKNNREKEVNFEKIEKQMDNLEKEFLPKISDASILMINNLVNEIKNKKIIEKKRLDQINKLELKNTTAFRMTIKNLLLSSYAEGKKTSGLKKYDMYTGLTDEEVSTYLDEKAFYITGVEEDEILKKIKAVLIGNIKSGNALRDVMLQIATISDQYKIGLENQGARIETIVRTNISDAYNQARVNEFKSQGDEIVAYQYSAILDSRVSDLCEKLDGKIIRPEDVDYYNPPNHFNCRSLLVPIFKDDETFKGFDEDNAPPATEASAGQFLKLKV